jgi:hypothetical protein
MKKIFVFLIFCLLTELILGQDTEFAIQEKVKHLSEEFPKYLFNFTNGNNL